MDHKEGTIDIEERVNFLNGKKYLLDLILDRNDWKDYLVEIIMWLQKNGNGYDDTINKLESLTNYTLDVDTDINNHGKLVPTYEIFVEPKMLRYGHIYLSGNKNHYRSLYEPEKLDVTGSFFVIYHDTYYSDQDEISEWKVAFNGLEHTIAKYVFLILSNNIEDVFFIDVSELL